MDGAGEDKGFAMADFVEILRCPSTRRDLRWGGEDALIAAEAGPSYLYLDGVARLLPAGAGALDTEAVGETQDFYDASGWQADEQGFHGETKAFVDIRSASLEYTRKCIARLARHFKGGEYLLDAGCGALPHDELLAYGANYGKRVCVDLSAAALRAARAKLGDRGVYLQGDLTNLPLKTGSVDAVTCNHVIYQIPAELQNAALLELWRVLKPGGVAVVVSLWHYAPLVPRLETLARLLARKSANDTRADPHDSHTELVHSPQQRPVFEAHDWPFRYRFDSFRLVDNHFMRRLSDDWRGGAFLNALFALQQMAPGFCGKYGAMPAIIISKD